MELIVTAEEVARRLGLPVPLADEVRQRVETAVEDAQETLVAHLGRPLLPVQYTESGIRASTSGWILSHAPVITVISAVPDATSLPTPSFGTPTYTVTYIAGIDASTDPETAPLRLWVRATACHHPLLADAPLRQRRIASASVEGQSVTYDTAAEPPVLLAPPDLATTDRWRLRGRRVYQDPVRPNPPGLTVPGGP
ncbi:hypothetical protein [Kitasatospora cineracea]|uniref:Uncharacterized protein n=1 Tax=Kitasatospora cineracea TaxID=88074 RepID=A0A8G1UFC3_9ACTN|nr:hypothetical protein [Kitasatospora cineracea]ROR42955.1 hypothetical protein EDD39_1090 [Kitasatospora cineracea]